MARKCSKCSQIFRLSRGRAFFFCAGNVIIVYLNAPLEAEGRTSCPASTGWLFWNLMAHPPLVKRALHRHRAGFKPLGASFFRKKVEVFQVIGEAIRACMIIPLFVLPFTLSIVLASSTCGDQQTVLVRCTNNHPNKIWHEQERLVAELTENGLVKSPRRDTRALCPAEGPGGKAPLLLAAQKSRPHVPLAPSGRIGI